MDRAGVSRRKRSLCFVDVSLFITCYNDTLFPETGKAVVRVLERLGHTIDFPRDQTCCGQMDWNTGYLREAGPIIRHFGHVFADVAALLPMVWEFSEFLVKKLGVEDAGASYAHRVTYHASCPSLRSLHLG